MERLIRQSGFFSEPKREKPQFISQYKPGDIVEFWYKGKVRQGPILFIKKDRERVVVDFGDDQLELHESKIKKVDLWREPMFANIFDLGLFKVAKWGKDIDVEQPGKWTNYSLEELKKKRNAAKKRNQNKREQGKKADPKDTELLRELNFAIRAKSGWGKASSSEEELKEAKKKKKEWDPNPWAVCYSVGLSKKKDPKKFEKCVLDVKKKQSEGKINIKEAWKDKLPGGLADKKKPSDFNKKSIEKGKQVEYEHTDDPNIATEIAMDHLEEHKKYYPELKKMEKKLEKEEKKKKSEFIIFDLFKEAKKKKEKKWIQEAVPESHEGKFKAWCKRNGFKGVCQECINKAIAQGGHSSRMANFAINVSKGKYKHPNK